MISVPQTITMGKYWLVQLQRIFIYSEDFRYNAWAKASSKIFATPNGSYREILADFSTV